MNRRLGLTVVVRWSYDRSNTGGESTLAAEKQLGGMPFLPGYEHQPLQGSDSFVGKVSKKDGWEIIYEIGPPPKPGEIQLGGLFSDRPKHQTKELLRW